ncbi:hypothetical protein SASPL_136250 [Salvia splendens]|uniref:Uncharacterized protein n=1 Tax=Salvia splendens TaxID=180675 RepID=A0A8X8X1C4_SALSN|nr:hypothetical protein SASPL_136250 [Salvia splendens]
MTVSGGESTALIARDQEDGLVGRRPAAKRSRTKAEASRLRNGDGSGIGRSSRRHAASSSRTKAQGRSGFCSRPSSCTRIMSKSKGEFGIGRKISMHK